MSHSSDRPLALTWQADNHLPPGNNMQTEFCKQLGIDVPIFAFTHCRDVVVAVSKAGGIGVLGAVGYSPEQLKEELDWIDEHIGDHIYGVDTAIPQKYEGMEETSAADLVKMLNDAIPQLAKDLSTKESPIIIVDQFSDFDAAADTYDGVHPNESGEKKMAQVWFDAIMNVVESN